MISKKTSSKKSQAAAPKSAHGAGTGSQRHDTGADTRYTGEVLLSGWRDEADKRELLHLVRHVGEQARSLNPEHRIDRIEDQGDVVKVLTSENQLAAAIGKRLDDARKGGTLEINWSDRDTPARVIWKGPAK